MKTIEIKECADCPFRVHGEWTCLWNGKERAIADEDGINIVHGTPEWCPLKENGGPAIIVHANDIVRQVPDPPWTCPQCGGTRVQRTAWLDANTSAELDIDPPFDHYWCPDCAESNGGDGSVGSLDRKGGKKP